MGHIHLGRLPKTQTWAAVIAALQAPLNVSDVATATMNSASDRLDALRNDPTVTYCIWLLTRIASAAKRPNFDQSMSDLGIPRVADANVVRFVSEVSARVRDEVERHPESGPFGDMALQALRKTLTETVGSQPSLLTGLYQGDVGRALREHATPNGFGRMLKTFFGDFLARSLRFYVDKELSLQVGNSTHLATSTQAISFTTDLDRHAREAARIVEVFSSDWYSLHDWTSSGQIGRDEVTGFAAEALSKIRADVIGPAA